MSKPSAYHTQKPHFCNIASICCQQDLGALLHLRGYSELGEDSTYPDTVVERSQSCEEGVWVMVVSFIIITNY